MNKIWILTKKELKTFFDSLIAYILIILFLAFTGFFTWLPSGADIFYLGQANLSAFFSICFWSIFFFIPLITMRSFSEENRSGTIELLLTKPVSDWQVVFGKYLSSLILIIIAFILTLPYYITITHLGKVDHGIILSGYLGLILISSAYIAIGIFASSISKNQIVSVLLSLCFGIFFQFISGILAININGFLSNILNFFSFGTHFNVFQSGQVDTKSIIYFLSLTVAALVSAESVIGRRKLSN